MGWVMAEQTQIKRVIRDQHTGRYLAEGGKWSDRREEGMHFQSIEEASAMCAKFTLQDVELVLQFDGSEEYDVVLDLCTKSPSEPRPAQH